MIVDINMPGVSAEERICETFLKVEKCQQVVGLDNGEHNLFAVRL